MVSTGSLRKPGPAGPLNGSMSRSRLVLPCCVDEIALGLMVDAYSRTELKGDQRRAAGGFVQSRRCLRLRSDAPAAAGDPVLPPQRDGPARTLDRESPRIASRYDTPTAAFVA